MDLNPIHHQSPGKKNEILIFVLRSTYDVGQTGQWTQTPSTTPLQPRKWNASFFIMFTSDDQPGWLMDSNPILHLSPAKEMKCSYFDYVQLLMIGQAGQWTQTPSATPLQPIKWIAHFWITFNFWWLAGLVDGLKTHPPPLSSQRNEMLIFVLCSTSNDRLGWSMDSNPIHHCFSAKNVKWFFFHYILHLMLARLVNGLEPHPPPLSSQKKWNAHFWVMFNFWWLVRLFKELKPHLPPLSSK